MQNISYIYKEGIAPQRHLLEHLCFYRSKNFIEAGSFYNLDNYADEVKQKWIKDMLHIIIINSKV